MKLFLKKEIQEKPLEEKFTRDEAVALYNNILEQFEKSTYDVADDDQNAIINALTYRRLQIDEDTVFTYRLRTPFTRNESEVSSVESVRPEHYKFKDMQKTLTSNKIGEILSKSMQTVFKLNRKEVESLEGRDASVLSAVAGTFFS